MARRVGRRAGSKAPGSGICIVTEGRVTEREYLEALRTSLGISKNLVHVDYTTGYNDIVSLTRYAIRKSREKGSPYEEWWVKRVIATEGQTVDIRDGRIFVDGHQLDEPYAQGGRTDPQPPDEDGTAAITYPHVIARGCVWVMGDNRADSRDSRLFGDVPASSVSSRVLCAYWPPERIGPVR